MNYSLALKEELICGAPHTSCCKRAYLHGLFYDAGATRDGVIVLRLASAAVRREVARVYREMYKKEALMDRNTMLFSSDRLLHDLTTEKPKFVCSHCGMHFLRGVMIAYGSVTDPEKGYHMEFNLEDPENMQFLSDVLQMLSEDGAWRAHSRKRKKGVGLYFKNSTTIEEILTYLNANNALFALINTKIERGIRNDENRATNCVAQNIGKAVDAAGRCCDAIEVIRQAARFDSLSEELRETASLRMENPGSSLSELAKLHNPPITKSGLNHRLQRIMDFAASLKIENVTTKNN